MQENDHPASCMFAFSALTILISDSTASRSGGWVGSQLGVERMGCWRGGWLRVFGCCSGQGSRTTVWTHCSLLQQLVMPWEARLGRQIEPLPTLVAVCKQLACCLCVTALACSSVAFLPSTDQGSGAGREVLGKKGSRSVPVQYPAGLTLLKHLETPT